MTTPVSSCLQITVPAIQSSSKTSTNVALCRGSISNMRAITCLLSLGKSLSSRQGPLMTSGFFSPPSVDARDASLLDSGWYRVSCSVSGSTSLATVCSMSLVDLECAGSDILRISVPGVGGDANNLYELSVMRGIFHGNRRKDMQQKIMANDQISQG